MHTTTTRAPRRQRLTPVLGLLLAGAGGGLGCGEAPPDVPEGLHYSVQTPEHSTGTLRRGDRAVGFELVRQAGRQALAISRPDGTPLLSYDVAGEVSVTNVLGDRLQVTVPGELARARASLAARPDLERQSRVKGDPKAWTDLQQGGDYPLVSELEHLLDARAGEVNYGGCGWLRKAACASVLAGCRLWCDYAQGNPPALRACMEDCVIGSAQLWCLACI
jgi:hypothetical protein